MIKPLNPIGEGQKKWSDLKKPNGWKTKLIQSSAGIYQVVFCDDQGNPQEVPSNLQFTNLNIFNQIDNKRGCHQFKGVLYIGKAKNLKDRFSLLCRSWVNQPKSDKLHGSRVTYNQNHDIQKVIPLKSIYLRFFRIGTSYTGTKQRNLTKEIKGKAGNFAKLMTSQSPYDSTTEEEIKQKAREIDALSEEIRKTLFPDDGKNRTHPSAGASTSEEYSCLIKFVSCFEHLPLLNKIKWESGETITEKDLNDYFEEIEKNELLENSMINNSDEIDLSIWG